MIWPFVCRLIKLPDSLIASVLKFLSLVDHLRVCAVNKALRVVASSGASWEVIKLEPNYPWEFWDNHPNALHYLSCARPRVLSLRASGLVQQSQAAFVRMLQTVERLHVENACFHSGVPAMPLLTHITVTCSKDDRNEVFAELFTALTQCEYLKSVEFIRLPNKICSLSCWRTALKLPIVSTSWQSGFSAPHITDVRNLAPLPLTALRSPSFTDSSIAGIAKLLPTLTDFDAEHSGVTDKGIAELRGLSLTRLCIDRLTTGSCFDVDSCCRFLYASSGCPVS